MKKKKYYTAPSMKTVCLRAENPILLAASNEKFEKNAGSVDDDSSTSFWETESN